MRKKLTSIICGSILSILGVGCSVIDKNQEFVYPKIVKELEHRNRNISLETIARKQDTLYAGASAVKITPHNQQYLAGFNVNRKSNGVKDDIYARCLVLSYNDAAVAIVSLDLLGFMNENLADVRHLLKQTKANFIDEIIIASTHTHSAPDTIGMWGPGIIFLPVASGIDKQYVGFVYDKILESIHRATNELREARLFYASTKIPASKKISRNIREGMQDEIDRQLSAMSFEDRNGGNIAVVTNYACHPEAFNRHSKKITPDFVGTLHTRIGQEYSGVSVFLNGAIGGLISVDIDDSKEKDLEYLSGEAERIGTALADETIHCLKHAKECKTPELKIYKKEFLMPVDNLFFRIGNRLGFVKKREHDGFVKTEMCRIDIGDTIRMGTVPGEIFTNVGEEIKEMAQQNSDLYFNIFAQDCLGYIMLPKDYASKVFAYEKTMCVSLKAGQIVMDNARELMADSSKFHKHTK